MSMLQEFKSFAMKGNVVDLAVGIVIGAASQSRQSATPACVAASKLVLPVGAVPTTRTNPARSSLGT